MIRPDLGGEVVFFPGLRFILIEGLPHAAGAA